jgi:3'-phosphoadenosine 5'-phosphosulfate sulfotransferase (PAPS reductase)/FAD synthetase
MNTISYEQLKQRQELPLDAKVNLSIMKIKEFYEHNEGKVYVAFSGGKDSTVMLNIVRSIYPEVPAVFVDTGLEYPEIKAFVNTIPNVTIIRPEKSFIQVIREYGYPIVSKKTCRFVRDCQNRCPANERTYQLRMTGIDRFGKKGSSYKLAEKWKKLIDAPFKVSEKCCDIMKKKPLKKYVKETGNKPFIGIMASDGLQREKSYLKSGCNTFTGSDVMSRPLAFWLEEDVWNYLKTNKIPYCKIYDMGEKRTGCMYCMFGVHLENGTNRFQRMKKSHPQLWEYCINKLNLKVPLNFIGVKYEPEPEPEETNESL